LAHIARWLRHGLSIAWFAAVGGLVALTATTHLATTVIVQGGSMAPALPSGSLAVLDPIGTDQVQPGDVVSARADNGVIVTHRVTRVIELEGETSVELKGDANDAPDPVLVPERALVGRIGVSLPLAGYLAAMLASALGLVSVVAMLAAWLAAVTWLEGLEAAYTQQVVRREVPSRKEHRAVA